MCKCAVRFIDILRKEIATLQLHRNLVMGHRLIHGLILQVFPLEILAILFGEGLESKMAVLIPRIVRETAMAPGRQSNSIFKMFVVSSAAREEPSNGCL